MRPVGPLAGGISLGRLRRLPRRGSYLYMANCGRNEAMDFADMRIREQEKANDQP
jgi:hypothetical protein